MYKMDHLACFAGAMYAVGAQDGGKYDAEYMALAGALGETCFKMYTNTATGLSPEFVQFVHGRDMVTPRTASYNIGRPEAAETWFYMWYYTKDPKVRRRPFPRSCGAPWPHQRGCTAPTAATAAAMSRPRPPPRRCRHSHRTALPPLLSRRVGAHVLSASRCGGVRVVVAVA
jgi:hypothetical protein